MRTCEDDDLVLQSLEICFVDDDFVVHIDNDQWRRDQQPPRLVDAAGSLYVH